MLSTPKLLWTSMLAVVASACGGGAPAATDAQHDPGPEETGALTATLTEAPSGAQCIQITIASPKTTKLVPLYAGSTASLDLGRLPSGNITVDANAYDQACSAIGTNDPSWIADQVKTSVVPGAATAIALVFHRNGRASASADFEQSATTLVTAGDTTYAVTVDGNVYLWGDYPLTSKQALTPTPFPGISRPVQIAASGYVGCAALADGTATCWGQPVSWSILANGQTSGSVGPGPVTGLSKVKQVAVAMDHACAVTTDDLVDCWGRNDKGQIGNGTTNDAPSPSLVRVPVGLGFLDGVQSVFAATSKSYALKNDGTVMQWGAGKGAMPVAIAGVYGATQLSVSGTHACVVRLDGTVRCWGSNRFGELGDGTLTQTDTDVAPVQVPGLTDVAQIRAGAHFTCALLTGGSIKCWGFNPKGSLGNGDVDSYAEPPHQITPSKPVVGITNAIAIGQGDGEQTCALLRDATVRCWGSNEEGTIGDGTRINRFVPVMPRL